MSAMTIAGVPAALVSAEAERPLPMPPVAFALIAFAAFLLALGVLWTFRNTANKVASKQARQQAAKDARMGTSRPSSGAQGHH